MASSSSADALTPAQVKRMKERLSQTNRKLAGLEASLKAMKEKHELVLRELQLSSKAQRKQAESEGGVISKLMDYIIDIKDILEMMKSTFQEIYKNENKIAERMIEIEQIIIESSERRFEVTERYRILAQLGELDSKILTLKFNGIPINQSLPNEILNLRSSILTNKDIPLKELQEGSLGLFDKFAEEIERAIENMSYKPETKEILESMREVSWM